MKPAKVVKPRNQTFKVTLEPAADAAFRIHCQTEGITYNTAIRRAINDATASGDITAEDVPGQRDIYGQLGGQTFTVRLSIFEIRRLERTALSLQMRSKRSYSRLIRYAIWRFLASRG